MATGGGVTCVIASGTADGRDPGDRVRQPRRHPLRGRRRGPEPAFKLWLRHAKPTLGRVVVDGGAATALRERGTSLLAVGVVSAQGAFSAGDAVEVIGRDGEVVGKGISAMSADEVRLVAGPQVGRGARADARRRAPGDPPRRVRPRGTARRRPRGRRPWCNPDPMTTLERVVADVAQARRVLARMPGHHRDAILLEMADALERRSDEILRENRLDVDAAKRGRSAPALIDRLLLDEDRVADMARAVRSVATLPDPIGTVDMGRTLPNGLELVRRRVPLGVVAVVYEGRPNVTVDAVSLCIKSGNAVILRGSRLASRSNLILAEVLTGALIEAEAPRWAVALLGSDRDELRRLVQMSGAVDLVIPRGGEDLKAFLMEHSRVPVIYAASGNNHVYVHADADLDMALKIAVNAKVQRPGVCNAAETLLVHRDAAPAFLPPAAARLRSEGVELRMDRAGLDVLGDAAKGIAEATDDYATEFLGLTLAVRWWTRSTRPWSTSPGTARATARPS